MGSSLRQWETDPLFSAAEVVQDSADRMESVFRLLLHEQGLVQGNHSDPKLFASIDYHTRDLATIIETAKWQLEDFEREASTAVVAEKSHLRDDVISRRKQFIEAIREQISVVKKSLQDSSVGNSVKSSGLVNLNDQDRDGLALFLTGGRHTIPFSENDLEDSSMFRRFIDPTTASSFEDCKIDSLNSNGIVHVDNRIEPTKANGLRKVVSRSSVRFGPEVSDSVHNTFCNGHIEDGSWDVEANEAKPNNLFPENISRGSNGRMNLYNILNNLWIASGNRLTRNYTKRIKDGEIHQQTSSYTNDSNVAEGQNTSMRLTTLYRCFGGLYIGILTKIIFIHSWVSRYWARCQRSSS